MKLGYILCQEDIIWSGHILRFQREIMNIDLMKTILNEMIL